MKAIIISDESEAISKLDATLVASGFDTIIYRWLLKALDNIEEIRPDLVIVSAHEYPRHWKTLTQFITSGIGGDKTKVFLLTGNDLNEEETEKAKALGIKGFLQGVSNEDIEHLKELLSDVFACENKPSENPVAVDSPVSAEPEPVVESDDEEIPTVASLQESHPVLFDSDSASLLFVNPVSGKMISGSVISYENKTVHFKPDYPEKTSSLTTGCRISTLTFVLDGIVKNYTAEVIMNNDALLMKMEEVNG